MSRAELRSQILDDGIRHTNFFNGRLLFAEDLWNDGEANRAEHRQLGRAVGEGIVTGLDVSIQSSGANGAIPSLAVTSGVALNRKGQALELPRVIELALVREEEKESADAGLFSGCLPRAGEKLKVGAGAYLLVMSPASGFSTERAPMSGLAAEGTISGCGSRYAVEGVQFRLETLPALPAELGDTTPFGASTWRDRVAHHCLGSHKLFAAADPLLPSPIPDALDDLRAANKLAECDVPIAAIGWSDTGLLFSDVWPVRRFVEEGERWWSPSRLRALAAIHQFQAELDAVTVSADLYARSRFFVLPPVGRIPVRDAVFGSSNGFNPKSFFGARLRQLPRFLHRDQLNAALRAALDFAPRAIDDIDEIVIAMVVEQVEAVRAKTATQLYAYFAAPGVLSRVCTPAVVFGPAAEPLGLDDLVATIEDAQRAYDEFRSLVLLKAMPDAKALTPQDAVGLGAIENVLRTMGEFLGAAAGGCLDNHRTWLAFGRMASAQQAFVRAWSDSVLPQQAGHRYRQEIASIVTRIGKIVEQPSFEGMTGLVSAVKGVDLAAEKAAQEKISGSFSTTFGTGLQGAISLRYTVQPAINAPQNATVGTLDAGTYFFGFDLNASVDGEATFEIRPNIAAPGWIADLWDDVDDHPRSTSTITLPVSTNTPGGLSRSFRVRVVVPAVADGTAVTLTLHAAESTGSPGVPPADYALDLVKGATPPVPDNRVIISLVGFQAPRVGNAFSLANDQMKPAKFDVRYTVAAHYKLTLAPAPGAPAWNPIPIMPATIDPPQGVAPGTTIGITDKFVTAAITPGAAAKNSSTDLILTVAADDANPPVRQTYHLPVVVV